MDDLADLLHAPIASASLAVGGSLPATEWIDGVGYVSIFERGVSFVVDADEQIVAIQLHASGHERFSEWHGAMPNGLSFRSGRSAARGLLGSPEQTGEVQNIPVLGLKPAWDRFCTGSIALHLEYDDDPEAGVRMMSVLPQRKVA
ncbi:hypothetical protein [Phenylobacterium aquaticum]|uniref:hypothetical protein n=1 Tax=Phenylobacterium aquaticum TaxID=1763816 RepID=UPI001F5C34A3|nr:hypothetical protein [Phenylobacterium aquaticum]MCI3131503.1 hypothetical protein [Phenylobacterium aquaticum]